MWFHNFSNSLKSGLQLRNKPLPRQKPTAETFSDTPLPAWYLMDKVGVNLLTLIFVDTLILSAMDLTLDSDKENK